MADFQMEMGPLQFEAGNGWFGSQYIQPSADNLTASTTHTVAGALQIVTTYARFTTVANANDACKLPSPFPGMAICVIHADYTNNQNMQVYGFQSGDTINGVVGSTGVSLMPGSAAWFFCSSVKAGVGTWTCQDIGVGNNGNYPTVAYQNNLTAGTTQTAAGGTPITSSLAEFDTVATNGNSATLPPAQPGMQISVINNDPSNHTLQVFAATQSLGGVPGGDTVNGATSVNMASPPVVTIFFSTKKGIWLTK